MQAKEKANEARMFSENQKLGNNVRFAPLLNTRLWEWFGYSLYRYKGKKKRYVFWHVKNVLFDLANFTQTYIPTKNIT